MLNNNFIRKILFQSLLYWIQLKSFFSKCRHSLRPGNVSILVVLDIAQELSNLKIICCLSSFNPCCTGYSSRAGSHIFMRLLNVIVSILVVLDIAQEPDNYRNSLLNYIKFQSLLYWIQLKSRKTSLSQKRILSVSILVVLDIAQEPRGTDLSKAYSRVSILVVLDIAQEQNIIVLNQGNTLVFQSLLYWIQLKSSSILLTRGLGRNRFQSLLYWIQLKSVVCVFLVQPGVFGFNPCCTGYSSRAFHLEYFLIMRGGCFNPCCTGYSSRAQYSYYHTKSVLEFQSLLYWIQLKST